MLRLKGSDTRPEAQTPEPGALARRQQGAAPAALTVAGGWELSGLPPLVRRAGPRAAERLVEFFTAQIRNPKYLRRLRRRRDAVLRLVRRPRARPPPDFADRRGHLHRSPAEHRQRAHRQTASGRHPAPVRLLGRRPGRADQSGGGGARGPRMSSGRARRRCCSPPKRGSCWTLSTRLPSPACAIARCWP